MAIAVAAAVDEAGEPLFAVTGVDLATPEGNRRVEALNRFEFPFPCNDDSIPAALDSIRGKGNLCATTNAAAYADADIIIVDVHLDVRIDSATSQAASNLLSFRSAIAAIGRYMRPGTLVIVETTVPPGTCEKVVAPMLAEAFAQRGLPADSFLLAHSYERVMPGADYLASIVNFWRIYAGYTPEAADACEAFLSKVINTRNFPLRRLKGTTDSEMAKVLENTYRAVNIALIDEWSRFAEAVEVDLFAIIDAIRVRPTHSNIRWPGFGVGGYCLTKDPLFPGAAARELFGFDGLAFPLSESAVRINSAMPLASLDIVRRAVGGDLKGKRLLLLGISYREDVADTRHSPAETFARAAQAEGAVVDVSDPLVEYWEEMNLPCHRDIPSPAGYDAAVFAVQHKIYRQLDVAAWIGSAQLTVLDANGVFTDDQRRTLSELGAFHSIGRGSR